MPYYRIIVEYCDGSSVKAIRSHNSWDVDFVYRYFCEQLRQKPTGKGIDDVTVVMISERSKEVKKYKSNQGRGTFFDRS